MKLGFIHLFILVAISVTWTAPLTPTPAVSTHAAPTLVKVSPSPSRYTITNTKGTYLLYWETVYVFNASTSYSTVIEPPPGYTLIDIIIGDSKLFRTERNENRAVVKRLAPDNAKTNMLLVLEGPDKVSRTLTFEMTGYEDGRVSSIQFIMPTDRDANILIEATKAMYAKQLTQALSEKEILMQSEVQQSTMNTVTTFRFGSYPKSTATKEYGVKVYLNSVLNSGGKGYIYLTSNANDPECQVVQLLSVKGNASVKAVKLVHLSKDRDVTTYVYETSPFIKDGEKHKYKFLLNIYSEATDITAKIL